MVSLNQNPHFSRKIKKKTNNKTELHLNEFEYYTHTLRPLILPACGFVSDFFIIIINIDVQTCFCECLNVNKM